MIDNVIDDGSTTTLAQSCRIFVIRNGVPRNLRRLEGCEGTNFGPGSSGVGPNVVALIREPPGREGRPRLPPRVLASRHRPQPSGVPG